VRRRAIRAIFEEVILRVSARLQQLTAGFATVKGLERGLFGAPSWIQVRSGSGLGLLIGGLEWI